MSENRKTVAIIGGGVAGIATAVALSEAGIRVQLFEKRPLLGGRASSSENPSTNERVDDCQHGTMRCCTNLADLLERLGVQHQIDYFDELLFLDRDGNYSKIAGGFPPPPLHTGLSFLSLKYLTLREKIGIGKAMIAMLREGERPEHEQTTIADWLRRKKQSEAALKRFWRPILVSACNEELERISCTHAFKIFIDGFMANREAYHFGVPRVPLGTLYTEPTIAYVVPRGGEIHTRTLIDQIHIEGGAKGRVTGLTLQNGTQIVADYYVSALQFDLLLKLLPSEVTQGQAYFENLRSIELAPLAGIHLWFDRPIDCPQAVALIDRETEWVFNKNLNFGLSANGGTYLSALISASYRYTHVPKEQLLEQVLQDIRECFPSAQEAKLLRSQVVRWPKATFVPKPGVEALRPTQRSPLSNLYLAGEWTATGWPSTMESAARSGYLVAEALLEDLGQPQEIVAPDLPYTGLVPFLLRL